MTGSRRLLRVGISEGVLAGCVAAVVVTLAELTSYSGWSSIPAEGGGPAWAVVAGVAVALVLLRRWLPSVALIAAALLFGRYVEAGVAAAVISYAASRRATPLAVAAVAPIAVAMPVHSGEFGWRYVVVVSGLASVVCVVLPALVGALLQQRERLVVTLRERALQLERANRLAASEGRLRERTRVAEEMHDLVGHRLGLLSLHAGALELDLAEESPDISARARLVRETGRAAMEELRSTLNVLRSDDREHVPELTDETGTRADVWQLVNQSVAAGVAVDLTWSGDDVVDAGSAVRAAVHRVVREALTNAHKHAAGAPVDVLVARCVDRLRVEVSNGPPPAVVADETQLGNGMGLPGLAERVRLLGGIFRAGRTQAGGFEVQVDLPLHGGAGVGVLEPAAPGAVTPEGGPLRAGLPSRLGMVAVHGTGLVAVAALLLALLSYLYVPPPELDIEADTNMAEEDVTYRVGGADPVSALAVSLSRPDDLADAPAGAQCWYRPGDQSRGDRRGIAIDRYCFVDGKLAGAKYLDLVVPESLRHK